MSNSLPSAVPFTPSDTVLLAHERFGAVPGPLHQFMKKAMSLLTTGLPLLASFMGAAVVCITLVLFLQWLSVAVLAITGGLLFWFRRTISGKLSVLWGKVKASEKRRDGTVNPFQRDLAVLNEPLAMALVSSALLANESAGVVQLVLDGNVLQAAPTGAVTLWPADSLEDRLRRNRRLPVAEMVEDWLAASSDLPYRRAVELAEHGMVTRGLAVISKASNNSEPVLTDATRAAATTIDGSAARTRGLPAGASANLAGTSKSSR